MSAVDDAVTSLSGGLSDLGCVFHTEASASSATRYVIVRKPVQAKIRVSDHKSHKFEKSVKRAKAMIEINVEATAWREALTKITDAINAKTNS